VTNPAGSDSLRARIEFFPLDAPGASLPFTSRLAREQGWSHVFAARAVREYKRFLVLAMTAGHPVTPSEAVDQVWHLHLVYTVSYWQELCAEILGGPLHHGPTAGGGEEDRKFKDWYGQTLTSYARVFAEPPPAELWPNPEERFAGAGAARWIDSRGYWIIPRPAWTRWTQWKKYFPFSR
jgi:hypothetical protein